MSSWIAPAAGVVFDGIAGSMPQRRRGEGGWGCRIGSDAVVRYREEYFSVPGVLLHVIAAALVPDRVQTSSAADCS